MPATQPEFWMKKISGNRERDLRTAKALRLAGWRRLTIWKCSLKGPGRRPAPEVMEYCAAFIRGEAREAEQAGCARADGR
jgi:DNA mismatch endonuclease (patch repair protein)